MLQLIESNMSKKQTDQVLIKLQKDLNCFIPPVCKGCHSVEKLERICIDQECLGMYFKPNCRTCTVNQAQSHKQFKHHTQSIQNLVSQLMQDIRENHNKEDIDFDDKQLSEFISKYNEQAVQGQISKFTNQFEIISQKCQEAIKYLNEYSFQHKVLVQGKNPYKQKCIELIGQILNCESKNYSEYLQELSKVTELHEVELSRVILKEFSLEQFGKEINIIQQNANNLLNQMQQIKFENLYVKVQKQKIIKKSNKTSQKLEQQYSQQNGKKIGFSYKQFAKEQQIRNKSPSNFEMQSSVKSIVKQQKIDISEEIKQKEKEQKAKPKIVQKMERIKNEKELKLQEKLKQEDDKRKQLANKKFSSQELLNHVLQNGKKITGIEKKQKFVPKYKEKEYDEMDTDDDPEFQLEKIKQQGEMGKLKQIMIKGKSKLSQKQIEIIEKQQKLNQKKHQQFLLNKKMEVKNKRSLTPQGQQNKLQKNFNTKSNRSITPNKKQKPKEIEDLQYNFVPDYIDFSQPQSRKYIRKPQSAGKRSQSPTKTGDINENQNASFKKKQENQWKKIQKELQQDLQRKIKIEEQQQQKYSQLKQIQDKAQFDKQRVELQQAIKNLKEEAIDKANSHGSHQNQFKYWRNWYQLTDPQEWLIEGGHINFPLCFSCKHVRDKAQKTIQTYEEKLKQVKQALKHLKSVKLKPRVDTHQEQNQGLQYKRNLKYEEIDDEKYKQLGLEDFSQNQYIY